MSWSDAVQEILDGDLAVALAHVTPAAGVVLTPVTNFALHDREAATVTVLSSLGAWRKLDAIRRDPRVALAFHTRRHGYADRPEYVLVQGTASFGIRPDRAWLRSIESNWERFMGPREFGRVWDWWMRVYHWERVGVRIAVQRVLVWADLDCQGRAEVFGDPPPDQPPPSQRPPAKGQGPRINHVRAARRVSRLPHTLLGWVGSDGLPVVVPVRNMSAGSHGIALTVSNGLVPPGGRRAGLTSHRFTAQVLGQEQHVHTGWLGADAAGGEISYAPHTGASYRLPPSKLLYRVLVGGFARRGLRGARRAGFVR